MKMAESEASKKIMGAASTVMEAVEETGNN